MNRFFTIKSSCVLCGDATDQPISLCRPCQVDLPRIDHACGRCGLAVTESQQGLCGQCLKTPPAIDYTHSLFYYESPIDYLIGQLKFEEKLACASIFGHLLAQSLNSSFSMNTGADLPDVIIPVPLHKKRLSKRGFNQSLEIARPVSKQLQLPIDTQCVRRTKSTRAQAKLNIAQRKRNIKGCFEIQKDHSYQHIILIDDVITTGSTINELARILKQSGVDKVGVWSIARAV